MIFTDLCDDVIKYIFEYMCFNDLINNIMCLNKYIKFLTDNDNIKKHKYDNLLYNIVKNSMDERIEKCIKMIKYCKNISLEIKSYDKYFKDVLDIILGLHINKEYCGKYHVCSIFPHLLNKTIHLYTKDGKNNDLRCLLSGLDYVDYDNIDLEVHIHDLIKYGINSDFVKKLCNSDRPEYIMGNGGVIKINEDTEIYNLYMSIYEIKTSRHDTQYELYDGIIDITVNNDNYYVNISFDHGS